jgi:hypothetical protein
MHRRNLVGMSVIATLALLPTDTPAAEFGEAAKGFLSNFGTWPVNEENISTIMVYWRTRTAICEVPPLLCLRVPRNHRRHWRFSSSAVGSGGSA